MERSTCCYSCLGKVDGLRDEERLRDPRGCTVPKHAYQFHASCAKAMDSCILCQHPDTSPVTLLCASALRAITTDFCLRPFLQEVARLCQTAADKPDAQPVVPLLYNGKACEIAYAVMSRCPHDDPDTVRAAFEAIKAMARSTHRDPSGRLRDTQGPYRLCRAIEQHVSSLSAVFAGLETVGALVQHDRSLMMDLESARVTSALLLATKPFYINESSIWAPAIGVLRMVLVHNRDLEDEHWLAAFGLMMDMLKICSHDQPLKVPERVRDMRQLTAQLIADFSTDEAMASLLFQHNACKYICVLLTKARADEGVQIAACQAVCSLTHHPAARSFFGGFLPALLKRLLETHGSSALATEAAMRTVALLCQPGGEPTIADAFGAASFCEATLAALERSEEGVVYEAIRALVNMARSSAAIDQRLRDLGTLEALRTCQAKWRALDGGKGGVCEEVNCATRLFEASSTSSVLSPRHSISASARSSASEASSPNHALKASEVHAAPSDDAAGPPVDPPRRESVGAVVRRASVELAARRESTDASALRPSAPLQGASERRRSSVETGNRSSSVDMTSCRRDSASAAALIARRGSVEASSRRLLAEPGPLRRDSASQAPGDRRPSVKEPHRRISLERVQDSCEPTSPPRSPVATGASPTNNRRRSSAAIPSVSRCMSPQGKEADPEGGELMMPSLPSRSSEADAATGRSPKIRVSASGQSPVNLSTEGTPSGSPLPRLSGRRASSATMTPPAFGGGSLIDGAQASSKEVGPVATVHANSRRASLKAPGPAGLLLPKVADAGHP